MGRKRRNVPVGRKNTFTGERLQWLDSRMEEFKACGDPGSFYTRVTQGFITAFDRLQENDHCLYSELDETGRREVFRILREVSSVLHFSADVQPLVETWSMVSESFTISKQATDGEDPEGCWRVRFRPSTKERHLASLRE